jgi:hypothetical protein
MKNVLCRSLVLALGVALVSSAAYAKNSNSGYRNYSRTGDWSTGTSLDNLNPELPNGGLPASAAATTLTLASYKFDNGATCTAQGWTTVDITQQTGNYWGVENFAADNGDGRGTMPGGTSVGGITFNPIQGTKSMWMGKRIPPAGPVDTVHCGYLALPGYGNGWNQAFCSKDCLILTGGSTSNLDIAFKLKFDSEPSYDGTALEYTSDCAGNVGWTEIAGGVPAWTAADSILFTGPVAGLPPTAVVSATVAVGGSGYAPGNQITLAGGTHSVSAVLQVATVGGGGVVTSVSVFNGGNYTVIPSNPVAQASTTGAGTGATFNVTWSAVKVRLHFTADTSWSNQDGFYPGLGTMVDSLSWETKAVETFEDEAVGATASNDWQACNTPGYGNYLALFKRAQANYEDQCVDNLSCYWAAISGSTEFYTCGSPSQPTQRIIPHVNVRGEYISNEIWSPVLPFPAGVGSDYRLRYTVYRDLPLDNLIFHVWHVRTISGTSCPGAWKDRNFVYYGDNKDWIVAENAVGSKLDLNTGVSMQAAIGVLDMCSVWCGVFGSGLCHSPAPYLDQVKILRIDTIGPQWDIRDIDTFQDTFATDGTTTGTARADEALDIKPSASPTFTPGDSAIVLYLVDPKTAGVPGTTLESGLSADPNISTFLGRHKTKRAVYIYVAVWPLNQAGKVGAPLSEGPGGQANRYPFIGTQVIGGVTWTCIRMDYTYTGTPTIAGEGQSGRPLVPARYNVDLNDNLFEPCDTVCYFYCATSSQATTYFSSNWGSTTNISDVAANPMEFTILPAGGWKRGGDILYVDGADGFGDQAYFDGALQVLSLRDKVDRFDVRGPSSGVSNRPGGRVYDVQNQLNECYQKILWDCGLLDITLGDASGDPEKTDDYLLLNTFLGNLTSPGGVYLCGDKVAQRLASYAGTSAVQFHSQYMPFNLVTANHRGTPTNYQISPKIIFWPGRCFSDNFFVFGGCPQLNDFDVMTASGSSLVEMSYNTSQNANGAVLSNVNGNAGVILSGFSFAYIRDDELDGVSDRARHLRDIIVWLGNPLPPATGAGPALKNELSQNYPNPFNPQTTIAFSLKERGAVSLKVYNVAGELVRTLMNESQDKGAHTKVWDGRNDSGQPVSSGVYFYKLVTNNFSQTKKMVLLK